MSQEEIVDEVVVNGPRPNSANAGRRNSHVQTEYIGDRGMPVRVERGGAIVEEDKVSESGRKRTPLRESTQKLVEMIDRGDDPPEEVAGEDPDDKGLVDPVEAAPAEEKAVDAAPSPADVITAERDRYAEHNRQLLAELDGVRKAPARGEPSEREKALDEAERTYLDDPIASVRRLIGTVLGVAHDSKDVDTELSGLYTDLTSRELNVPLEAAHKATREAIRARQMLARDKRERKAESEATVNRGTQDEESRHTEEAATFIDGRLSTKSMTGKSIADDHPLLMQFAEELDGMKPSTLLWKVIQRETKTGVLDPKMPDDQMIPAAAKLVERHYQSLAERFGKARPTLTPTDTAKTDPAKATANASQEQRQTPGARTITNATASVAPATSPTKKAAPKQEEAPPKFKTNKERQEWALRHIPS